MSLGISTYEALQETARRLAVQIEMLIPDLSLLSPQRYVGNPTIPLAGWYLEQIFDFQVMADPSDATKLVMYASGMVAPVATGVITIGRLTSTVAGYTSWADQGQVFLPGTAGAWDDNSVRMGSCFYVGGTLYLYYTGWRAGQATQSVGLATSTNGTTFTRYAGNPILTPTGQGRNDGDHVSEPCVVKEGSSWTMIYAYRNGSSILPGYRYATSSDGLTWTKGGSGDILTAAPLFCEFHQILHFDSTYYLLFEAENNTNPTQLYLSSSSSITGPFAMPGSPWFTPTFTPGTWDRYHVATPNLVQVGGNWQLFYCGAGNHDQPYYTNTWPGGVALVPYTPGQGWLRL